MRASNTGNLSAEASAGKDLGTQSILVKNRKYDTPIIYNGENIKEKISWGLFSTNNYDTTNLGYDKFYPNTVDVSNDEILDFYFKIERENEAGELVAFSDETETVKRKYFLLSNILEYIESIESGGDGVVPEHRHNRLYDSTLTYITLSTITENGNLIHNPSPNDIVDMDNDTILITGVKNSLVLGSNNYSITQGTVNDDDVTPNNKTAYSSIISSRTTGIHDSSFAMVIASEGEDLISAPIIDTESGGDSDGIIGGIELVNTGSGYNVELSSQNVALNSEFIVPIMKIIKPYKNTLYQGYNTYPISGDSAQGEPFWLIFEGDLSSILTSKTLLVVETIDSNCNYFEMNLGTNNSGNSFRVVNNFEGSGETVTILFPSEYTEIPKEAYVDIVENTPNIIQATLPLIGAISDETTIGVGESFTFFGIGWGGTTTFQVYPATTSGQTIAGGANYAMNGYSNNRITFTTESYNDGGITKYRWVVSENNTCPYYSTSGGGTSEDVPSVSENSKYVIAYASYDCKLKSAQYSTVTGLRNIVNGNGYLPRFLLGKHGQLGSDTNTLFGVANGTSIDENNLTIDKNLVLSVGFETDGDSFVDVHENNINNVKNATEPHQAVNLSQITSLYFAEQTDELQISNSSTESISGNSTYQNEANIEFVTRINTNSNNINDNTTAIANLTTDDIALLDGATESLSGTANDQNDANVEFVNQINTNESEIANLKDNPPNFTALRYTYTTTAVTDTDFGKMSFDTVALGEMVIRVNKLNSNNEDLSNMWDTFKQGDYFFTDNVINHPSTLECKSGRIIKIKKVSDIYEITIDADNNYAYTNGTEYFIDVKKNNYFKYTVDYPNTITTGNQVSLAKFSVSSVDLRDLVGDSYKNLYFSINLKTFNQFAGESGLAVSNISLDGYFYIGTDGYLSVNYLKEGLDNNGNFINSPYTFNYDITSLNVGVNGDFNFEVAIDDSYLAEITANDTSLTSVELQFLEPGLITFTQGGELSTLASINTREIEIYNNRQREKHITIDGATAGDELLWFITTASEINFLEIYHITDSADSISFDLVSGVTELVSNVIPTTSVGSTWVGQTKTILTASDRLVKINIDSTFTGQLHITLKYRDDLK